MQVAVEQARGVQRHAAEGFDGGAVVEHQAGTAGGLVVGVQPTADEHVAGAEDQRLLAVVDEAGADIQAFARSDDSGAAVFLAVVHDACADGELVAVDAPGTDVVQGAGLDAGLAAVDQAAVGEGVGGRHQGLAAADLAGDGVVDIVAAHFQLAGLEDAAVGELAGAADDGAAVDGDFLVVGEVLLQGQGEVALGQQATIAAQGVGGDAQGLAGQERAGLVERAADGHREAARGGDAATGVVEQAAGAAAGYADVLVGGNGAGGVVDVVGGEQHAVALQAERVAGGGAEGVAVEDLPGGEDQVSSRNHKAGVVVGGAHHAGAQVVAGLELAAVVGQGGGAELDVGAAAELATGVIEVSGVRIQVALGVDEAGAVVQVTGCECQCRATEDATGGAGIGVGQRLAVGVDAHGGGRLQQAAGVVQRTAVHGQGAASAGECSAGVVEHILAGIDLDVGAEHAAAGIAEPGVGEADIAFGLQGTAGILGAAAGVDAQVAVGGDDQACVAVVERAALEGDVGSADQLAASVVQRLPGGEV
ncbi:hypothetical protein D9M68_248280 [compost metagenome]